MSKKKESQAQTLGKLGGKATLKKYGPDHFSKLGKKSQAKRRKMARLAVKAV